MSLPVLILGTIPGYLAAGLSLMLGASWLMALLTLSGVGVACTFILAAILAAPPRGPQAPRAMAAARHA